MMRSTQKFNILFLCTGNSCRSQMAEGWTRHFFADTIEPYSAGIEVHGLNPYAVEVMAEAGVDISQHYSKHVNELKNIHFDLVITVCGHAHEHCPILAGQAKVIHVGFDDPPKQANQLPPEQRLLPYRKVRDQIEKFIRKLPQVISDLKKNNGSS